MCSSFPRTPSPLQSRRVLCVRDDSASNPLSIPGERASAWVAPLAMVLSALCISATLLFIHSSHLGLIRPHHDSTQLFVDSGCRCSSTALIGTLVSPQITGGGTWDRPVFTANITTPRLIQTSGSVSVTMGAGVGTGTGAHATISGGAMAGDVTVHTSSTVGTAARNVPLFTLTFAQPYAKVPALVMLSSAGDANAARLASTSQPFVFSKSTTGFVVHTNSAQLARNTIYTWAYLVVG